MIKQIKASTLILLTLLSFPGIILSQNKKMDNLKNELKIHTKKDTLRVNILNTLAFNYVKHNVKKAEEKTQQANSLAKELNYTNGEARSFFVLGEIHKSKFEYDEALKDYLKALRLYEKTNNDYNIYTAQNALGTIYLRKNDYNEALTYYNKALRRAKNNNDFKTLSGIQRNKGNISFFTGNLKEAVTFYKKSIASCNETGDQKCALGALSNMAIIYIQQGRTNEALEILNKCLVIHRENNDKKGIATVTLNISAVYWELFQTENTLKYIQESLSINRELKDKRSIAKCLTNIGAVYTKNKNYSKALNYFTEAQKINKELHNKQGLVLNLNQIGDLYLLKQQPEKALSNFKEALSLSTDSKLLTCYSLISLAEAYNALKKLDKALEHGLKGKLIADELELLPQQREITNTLSKVYEKTGKFEKSLKQFKLYKILNDSLFNKENIEKIAQLEYDYKYKRAIDSTSLRELKLTKTVKSTTQNLKKSQRNLFFGIITFLTLGFVLVGIIFFLRLRHERSKTQNIAIEQKLLRSQMTPHFIFNSLSVLQGMILNKEYRKSIFYLSKFSKLLRITLENSRDKMVPLNQELTAVNNYLELQNLEESQAYQYTTLVDETINTALFDIPPMLIQPFIENAIEHGFKNIKENRKIDIQLTYSNKELICTIKDNGIGIDTEQKNKRNNKKSLATTITSERLKTLSKNFKTKGSISIENRQKYNEQGTIVTLVIPYKT